MSLGLHLFHPRSMRASSTREARKVVQKLQCRYSGKRQSVKLVGATRPQSHDVACLRRSRRVRSKIMAKFPTIKTFISSPRVCM